MQPRSSRTHCLETGRIIVPRSDQEVADTIARWRAVGPQRLALDFECAASATVPNGTGLHPHLGTIRLAQYAVENGGQGVPEALVVETWEFDDTPARELVESEDWPTLVHYSQMESRWLAYAHGIRIGHLIDTCALSKETYDEDQLRMTLEAVEQAIRAGELRAELRPTSEDPEEFALQLSNALDVAASEGVELDLPRVHEWELTPAGRVSHSLGIVTRRRLNWELSKEWQNSYWDAVKLVEEQLQYAGEDVLSLLDLGHDFDQRITPEQFEAAREKAERIQDSAMSHSGAQPRNCESERATRMIKASQTLTELARVEDALTNMRIHHSNRTRVIRALRRTRRKLERGEGPTRPLKVRVASWRQPF